MAAEIRYWHVIIVNGKQPKSKLTKYVLQSKKYQERKWLYEKVYEHPIKGMYILELTRKR